MRSLLTTVVLVLAGVMFAAGPASANERVVYAPQPDGSFQVVEGDWTEIPTDGSAAVTIVTPGSAAPSTAPQFAQVLAEHARTPVKKKRARDWRGAPRVIVAWRR